MPTKIKNLYQVKQLQKKAEAELDQKARRRSSAKPIKQWSLTYINQLDAEIGATATIEAKDYVQALEHALYAAGFFLEKKSNKAKNLTKR